MPIQSTSTLTPEMIQQMIQSAFSALSLSGKSPKTSMWYMDSGASNQMTYSCENLESIQNYDGNLDIQISNS